MKTAKLMWYAMAASAVMPSCAKTGSGDGYHITGTAPTATDGDPVYLCELQGYGSMVPQDTAYVSGGKFSFDGKTEGAQLRFVIPYHDGVGAGVAQIILENADITVDVAVDPEESKVVGGQANTLWTQLSKESSAIALEQQKKIEQAEGKELSDDEKAQILSELDELNSKFLDLHYRYIVDNLPSDFSDMLLGYTYEMLSQKQQAELMNLFKEKQPQSKNYQAFAAEALAAEPTSVGKQFTDFELQTPGGESLKLSDVVAANKLTLVDFWASWCGPCRREMPNVVKAYEAYHAQGFEVLGVSLDNEKGAWTAAIKALEMPWPQVSDLKQWGCVPAQTYNVKAIPANVLISKDGTIIARDLFGGDLSEVVGNILAQQK